MGKMKDMKEKYCPHLFVEMADPLGELLGVGNGGRQKDIVDIVRQQNDGLLPYHTTIWKGQEENFMSHYIYPMQVQSPPHDGDSDKLKLCFMGTHLMGQIHCMLIWSD